MHRRLCKVVALGFATVVTLLACCSESEARCALFRRWHKRKYCPPACYITGQRCAIYYSGKLGDDVYMHYGGQPTSCSSNTGPVYLTSPYCMGLACGCYYEGFRCVDTARKDKANHVADGIKRGATPNNETGNPHNLERNIAASAYGMCELVDDNGQHVRDVCLRFVKVRRPRNQFYYFGYEEEPNSHAPTGKQIKIESGTATSVVKVDPDGNAAQFAEETFELLLARPGT